MNPRALTDVMDAGGYLADALRGLDGLTRCIDVAAQAKALLKDLTASTKPVDSPLATGRVTMEWLDAAVEQELAVGELRRRQRILETLIEQAQSEAVDVVELNGDVLLRTFAVDLAGLLEEVRATAADLKGARSAGEAIANGTTAAWADLQSLNERHKVIRSAQKKVMANSYQDLLAAHSSAWSIEAPASDCYLSNLDQVWPGCTNRNAARPDPGAGRAEPWPADEVEQLIWAATSGARPWIPTPDQLNTLTQARIEERRKQASVRGNRVS
ncbi:hypothetical protein A5699_02080 [Mycobacterium sp. E802]|uniref:hypothetical protein n=1 Tax=Mycobacterium sp. E802 TaxID=1834152 RepID=UPI0007FE9BF7|nr:hypothetical protein [Mycobacterium sp. E802]OBG87537.1 hypothetical protein A5699_02080 [Mycobacterium sp. E802]